jgi:myo-inositol 2-dehydrogenase/D-chiro-inositol 1-dehydrogenase
VVWLAVHPLTRVDDESYLEAKRRIDNGQLGKAYMIKSATNDQYDPSGFFIAYSKDSGGIFLDCGIHDIDIARWLLDVANPSLLKNPAKQVTRVYATGLNVRHPELAESEDCDNANCIVEFENGTQCTFHLSRTALHGHDCFCEVFGTESKLVINGNPNMTRVEIRDEHGVRMEST